MASTQGIRAGRAFVELFADDSRLVRGLRRAERRLKAFGANVSAVGRRVTAIGAAAAVPFVGATRVFTAFSDQMLTVKAVTGATEAEFVRLTDQAKLLGRTTSFTAAQVAGAMTELGRAGFRPQQIEAAIAAVLDLARASGTELPRAAEIASAVLRGFNLPAEQTGRVADVLTATVNNSAQTMEDLGEAMKLVAPIAIEAGESLEDTAAALGVLANNAIKGSLAGNAIARAYKNLSNRQIAKQVEDLGVAVTDTNGNLRPLAAILTELGQKTKNLGSAERLSIFEDIFGRGQAAALKLASATAVFDDLQSKIKDSGGVAAKTAKIMDSGLGGAIRRLLSAVEGVAIAVGESLADSLSSLADRMSDAAGFVTRLINKNKQLVVTAAKIVAIVIAVGLALIVMGTIISAAGTVLGLVAGVITGVGAAIGLLGSALAALLSPIGLVVTAVVGLGVAILQATGAGATALGWLAVQFTSLKEDALAAFQGVADALAAGDITLAARILWLGLQLQWQKGVAALSTAWAKFKDLFLKIATEAFYGALILLNNAWAGMQIAWVETTMFLANAWTRFTSGLTKTWNEVQNTLTKGWLKLMAMFDEDLNVDAAMRMADEDLAAQNRRVDTEARDAVAERHADRQRRETAIVAERDATQRAIVEEAADADRASSSGRDAAIAKTEADLAKARREFTEAIAKARAGRAAIGGEDQSPPAGVTAKDLIDQVKEQLSGLTERLGSAVEVRGTFNAAALQGLASTTTDERIAKASEQAAKAAEETAKNTRRIERAIVENKPAFG